MKSTIGFDLGQLPWTLRGTRPFVWRWGNSMETGAELKADITPVAVSVPGSVQQALLNAGILPDWHVGLQSRDCEWVEHRHWIFETTLPAEALPSGEKVFLCADGLDYSGWVLVDGAEIATFEGALVPHVFELPDISDGEPHVLHFVFSIPPEEQGQVGYTVQSRWFKPRYNFSWDWCPRFVPIGIWDSLRLEAGSERAVQVENLQTTLGEDNRTGGVRLVANLSDSTALSARASVELEILDGDEVLASTRAAFDAASVELVLENLSIAPWWPNGAGEQKLYTAKVRVSSGEALLWEKSIEIGFKRIEWQTCEGSPQDAEPWICVVNGQPLFLQGANWTPVKVNYHDTSREDYARIIGRYQEMGANVLRVWGGAFLEKADFYELCDQAGLLVWQEFPLSSSGIDNWPPEDAGAIEELERIATSYIRRRRHHVSLLLWCGGNELQGALDGGSVGIGKPVTYAHPCIGALQAVVEREDPGRRFLPTSSSGPRFMADAENYGQGIHHDVHGPWGLGDDQDMAGWREYWEGDDSLFRSETGVAGASSRELIHRYQGNAAAWPLNAPLWLHSSSWWTQEKRFGPQLSELSPEEAIAAYVRLTQAQQAEALEIAASVTKNRFPQCGGFLVWMGHDCFPCLSNTSVIDFEGNFKPAGLALGRVFRGE